jgi:hypothetical protein
MGFPDVCKTPAPPAPFVPIPYPNIGQCSQAKGSTTGKKVKLDGGKAVVQGTEISMSSGDEAGTAGGGMVSAKFKGKVKCNLGGKPKACGKKIAYVGTPWSINNNNGIGAQIAPSTTSVKVLPG